MIETASEAIEAFHLTFLAHLSKAPNKAVVKGGQNLRLFFESVRHSDDLDMDVSVTSRSTLKKNVDKILASPRFRKALLPTGSSRAGLHAETDRHHAAVEDGSEGEGLSEPVQTRISLHVESQC
jgi:hypothetical protein